MFQNYFSSSRPGSLFSQPCPSFPSHSLSFSSHLFIWASVHLSWSVCCLSGVTAAGAETGAPCVRGSRQTDCSVKSNILMLFRLCQCSTGMASVLSATTCMYTCSFMHTGMMEAHTIMVGDRLVSQYAGEWISVHPWIPNSTCLQHCYNLFRPTMSSEPDMVAPNVY